MNIIRFELKNATFIPKIDLRNNAMILEYRAMIHYNDMKDLLKEAHRLIKAYSGEEITHLLGLPELSMAMARNSFVAHSVYAGYDRVTVERIAEYVFHPYINKN